MKQIPQAFSFLTTFVLPALLNFLIPLLSLLFFLHAQARLDEDSRVSMREQILNDANMSPQNRQEALAVVDNIPFSQMLLNEDFASQVDSTVWFHFATFRWMIRLSIVSLVGGVAILLIAGLCVWLSFHSPAIQYWSLSLGWHILRLYCTYQTVATCGMLVALSFWVTALWFNIYIVKLIFVVAIFALFGVGAIIVAIFQNPKQENEVEGDLLQPETVPALWAEIGRLCAQLNTDVPQQIIAGIDDNFFVTEHPVTVHGVQYHGKTLFVSLSLLKQLHGEEARAVLAHELAHFSGQDTYYSQKISPLLLRYDIYLKALHDAFITLPVYYFMLCFRALYELSLGKIRREREFRADRIAAETTSNEHAASALLRVVAYSDYRSKIEHELFNKNQVLESVDVQARVEQGFAEYSKSFLQTPELAQFETSHPFDSHPPLSERLAALGFRIGDEATTAMLASEGNGLWREHIPSAAEMEREQWETYENRFRDAHELALAYRYLPATPEEQAVVEKFFPKVTFERSGQTLSFDCDEIQLSAWPDGLKYSEITLSVIDGGVLTLSYTRQGARTRPINIHKFAKADQPKILITFQSYYHRHLQAKAYCEVHASPTEQTAEGTSEEA